MSDKISIGFLCVLTHYVQSKKLKINYIKFKNKHKPILGLKLLLFATIKVNRL